MNKFTIGAVGTISVLGIIIIGLGIALLRGDEDSISNKDSKSASEFSKISLTDRAGTTYKDQSIYENLSALTDLSDLKLAVDQADLEDTLSDGGDYTIFAPSNNAFDTLSELERESLFDENRVDDLIRIIEMHAIYGAQTSDDIETEVFVNTVLGEELLLYYLGDQLYVNSYPISTTDVVSKNGVIHIIEEFIPVPVRSSNVLQNLEQDRNFESSFVGIETLTTAQITLEQPYTYFLPTIDGFNRLPAGETARILAPENSQELQGLMSNHIVENGYITEHFFEGQTLSAVNGNQITVAKTGDMIEIESGGRTARILSTHLDVDGNSYYIIDNVLAFE